MRLNKNDSQLSKSKNNVKWNRQSKWKVMIKRDRESIIISLDEQNTCL